MLYSKKDLINAIEYYISVLEFDKKSEKNDNTKIVLNNVIISLKDIIKNYNK